MTEYRVVFANATPSSINIRADKVNLGTQKLWFYDSEDHLIAVYRWDQLIGFDVVGSSADQIFTNALLHERKPPIPDRNSAIEQRGKLMILLEEAVATLRQAKNDISERWVGIHDEVKQTTRTELLVQRHEAELRDLQVALIDGNRGLQQILDYLQSEFKDMGLPGLASSAPAVPPAMIGEPESQEKRKKWFS